MRIISEENDNNEAVDPKKTGEPAEHAEIKNAEDDVPQQEFEDISSFSDELKEKLKAEHGEVSAPAVQSASDEEKEEAQEQEKMPADIQEADEAENGENAPESENADGETEATGQKTGEAAEDIGKKQKKKRRSAKAVYAVICVILVLVGTAYGFVNAMLDKVNSEETQQKPQQEEPMKEIIYEEEDYELFSAVNKASSINDYVDKWYDSGTKMHSKNVINVLLVGLDSKNGLTEGKSRSDTMMVVSLNTKTKQIKMVSFFRDTWAKFVPDGGSAQFNKMNASYFYGGINCTVETIERMFKLQIDHYVIVDFNSFKDLVDAVGGIKLYVQEYEAKNMKREWNIDVDFSKSEDDPVLLNGKQAFWFVRQRHSDADADVSRTRRQRQAIMAFIDSCKGASISQLSALLNKVFVYVKTDLTKNEILGYATRALAFGWLNYDISTIKISDYSMFRTPTLFGQSIVVQDYPVVAKLVQEEIYGETNIVLDDNRTVVFNLYKG